MNNGNYRAFTTKANALINKLISKVVIKSGEKTIETLGLWDTGATGSCISAEVAQTLGLKATGKLEIRTPTGSDIVETYLVDVGLPNKVLLRDVMVSNSAIGAQGIGMLIGMNIISAGDFAISKESGNTVFSFVMPSMSKIDFIPKANALNKAMQGHRKSKKNK